MKRYIFILFLILSLLVSCASGKTKEQAPEPETVIATPVSEAPAQAEEAPAEPESQAAPEAPAEQEQTEKNGNQLFHGSISSDFVSLGYCNDSRKACG